MGATGCYRICHYYNDINYLCYDVLSIKNIDKIENFVYSTKHGNKVLPHRGRTDDERCRHHPVCLLDFS